MTKLASDNASFSAVNVDALEDVTRLARRAGIRYPVLVDPELRASIAAQYSPPDGSDESFEPLFHLLVPFRFVAGVKKSACRFEFGIGPRNSVAGQIVVRAAFNQDAVRGCFFTLTARPTE